jgi:hypothetical protein
MSVSLVLCCLPRELARESHAIRNHQIKFAIPFFFHILHTEAAKFKIALEDIIGVAFAQ